MERKNVFEHLSHIVLIIQCIILVPTIYGYLRGHIGVNLVVFILVLMVVASMLYCMYLAYRAPRVYVAHSIEESLKIIKQMYKKVDSFLDKNKLIYLYEANLETNNPGSILSIDKKMAVRNTGVTVKWKMVILKTSIKEPWIENWKKDIWRKNDDCELYIVSSEAPLKEYHLLNFVAIPDIGETYIGYGNYTGFQGGGIRIRDKRISMEFQGVIDNWARIGQEEQRLP